ncbi:hypothetical protein [Sunxiuqinia rutila]|uniref:hypothetical protein n=1 Tax=Sunxiuqinia rutila TaxID=1397841 RepID=UPI003D36CF78
MEKEYYQPTTEEWAEMAEQAKKMYIDSFETTYLNVVDPKLEESLVSLREKHKESMLKYSDLVRNIVPAETEEENIQQQENKYYASMFYTEDLKVAFCLYELRIMYEYKYFEIKLNELGRLAFEKWNESYRWKDTLINFKNQGINLSSLTNFQYLDEYRRVNNALKHSGNVVTKKIKNIKEFSTHKVFHIGQLKPFYERVKDAPSNFISELSTVAYNRLWPDEESNNIDHEFELFDDQEIEF